MGEVDRELRELHQEQECPAALFEGAAPPVAPADEPIKGLGEVAIVARWNSYARLRRDFLWPVLASMLAG